MALKGDRHELVTDISFFMNEVAERGGVVVFSTAGSGAALDDAAALVTYAANGSGKVPVGILLNDMVSIDQTRQHLNWHKDEVQKGSKVTVLRNGWVVTDRVNGTPTVGQTAYVADSGRITPTSAAGYATLGVFLSVKDNAGFAKVAVNLP